MHVHGERCHQVCNGPPALSTIMSSRCTAQLANLNRSSLLGGSTARRILHHSLREGAVKVVLLEPRALQRIG